MDPADPAATDDGVLTLGHFLSYAGPWAVLACLAGVIVLLLAVRVARRRGPRRHALALFAAAWLPLLPVLGKGTWPGTWWVFAAGLRWSDRGAEAIRPFMPPSPPTSPMVLLCATGLLLSLIGAVAALARCRGGAHLSA